MGQKPIRLRLDECATYTEDEMRQLAAHIGNKVDANITVTTVNHPEVHQPDQHTAEFHPDRVEHTFTGPDTDGTTHQWQVTTRHPNQGHTMNGFSLNNIIPQGAVVTGLIVGVEYLDPEKGDLATSTYIEEGTKLTTGNALANMLAYHAAGGWVEDEDEDNDDPGLGFIN